MKKKKNKRFITSDERKKMRKVVTTILLSMLLVLGVLYFILKIIYESGPFTVTLDEKLTKTNGLIMYEKMEDKIEKRILKSTNLEFLDNISVNWIPQNISESTGGANNGDNYIAYTFYLENQGVDPVSYWYSTVIDDVIKDVDEAIRIKIYLNGESKIYAKRNEITGQPEQNTTAFYSEEYAEVEQRKNLMPGDTDKFTIVIWIEGDDPDCIDSLIGGELKMHMEITQEQINTIQD